MIDCIITEARAVKDEDTLESLAIKDGGILYLKDLGMYIAMWVVSGSLDVFHLFCCRPSDRLVYCKYASIGVISIILASSLLCRCS